MAFAHILLTPLYSMQTHKSNRLQDLYQQRDYCTRSMLNASLVVALSTALFCVAAHDDYMTTHFYNKEPNSFYYNIATVGFVCGVSALLDRYCARKNYIDEIKQLSQ